MPINAVIFDVDGTLVDSNGLHALAWERAFASVGLSVPAARVLPFIGEAGDRLVPSLVSVAPATAQDLGDRSSKEFERLARERGIAPYPGAEELLRALRRRRIKLAVATSGGRAGFQVIVETSQLPALGEMDVVVTDDDVKDAKPAPDLVSKACRLLGCAPAECLMIGDTPYDGAAARRAAVPFIAVATGVHAEPALRQAGAIQVYRGASALLERLDEIVTAS
jgi:HAD superfamily hydrolase (TIGR01509 family)